MPQESPSPRPARSRRFSRRSRITPWLPYIAALALRLYVALFSTAYIHPDEYFQSTEVVAGDLLGIETIRTWEFDPQRPCRSMASVKLFSLPLILLVKAYRVKGLAPSARTIFYTQRLTAFAISLVVDVSLYLLVARSRRTEDQRASRRSARRAAILFASSGSTLTFLVRPFSNGVETALLAVSLVCVNELKHIADGLATEPVGRAYWKRWSSVSTLLGIFLALGSFSRFTFAVFAMPLGLNYIYTAWSRSSARSSKGSSLTSRAIKTVSVSAYAIFGFLFCSVAHVLYDTAYFRGDIPVSSDLYSQAAAFFTTLRFGPIIAPLNALRYNLQQDNLAEHGLHPRWLHFVVNAPMILGIAVWIPCLHLGYRALSGTAVDRSQQSSRLLYVSTLLFPLFVLSVQPHQEPRFLLPLMVPAIALLSTSSASERGLKRSKAVKWFLRLHLVQSVAMTLFFSFGHQAGLITALLDLNDALRSGADQSRATPLVDSLASAFWKDNAGQSEQPQSIQVHVWRTFMPPRHLLLPYTAARPQDAKLQVQAFDHGSLTPSLLRQTLLNATSTSNAEDSVVLLLSPSWAMSTLYDELRHHDDQSCSIRGLESYWPHLDMDHLGESIKLATEGGQVNGQVEGLINKWQRWNRAFSLELVQIKRRDDVPDEILS